MILPFSGFDFWLSELTLSGGPLVATLLSENPVSDLAGWGIEWSDAVSTCVYVGETTVLTGSAFHSGRPVSFSLPSRENTWTQRQRFSNARPFEIALRKSTTFACSFSLFLFPSLLALH